MKKNFKRFFTLKHKANDGFTLVELIVVIAILAILSGVAVPAYSAYIEKSKRAADETLLGAVNTAFAAACASEGNDVYNVTGANLEWATGKKAVTGVASVSGVADASGYDEAFAMFYAGNETTEFQVFEGLYFDSTLHVFKNLGDSIYHQIFSGLDLEAYVNLINASTFGGIGAEGLMSRVHDVTELAEALLALPAGSNLKNALSADVATLAASMGMTVDELQTKIASQEDPNAYYNNLLSNYAVLQVADTTSGKSTNELLTDLKTGMTTTDISNMIASDDTASSKEGVAKAAMMYAMYTAYANQLPEGTDEEKQTKNTALANLKDMDAFVIAVNSETQPGTGFMTYLDSPQATTDMEGFRASMNVITESTENNTDATRDLLENGYNNSDLIGGLDGLFAG